MVFLVLPAMLLFAAAMDLFTMTIPNRLSLAIAAAFFLAAPLAGLSLEAVGWHVLAGFAMLAIGFALFSFGWIGGGDAKLFAATSLWLGWADLPVYIVISTMLGGALTLAILAARRMPLPPVLACRAWLARLHDRDTGVPYGIALAAGAMFVYADSAWIDLVAPEPQGVLHLLQQPQSPLPVSLF